MLHLLLIIFMLSRASCQFQVKTAISPITTTATTTGSTSSTNSTSLRNRIVSCSKNQTSTLMIRTAYYLITPTPYDLIEAKRDCSREGEKDCPVTAADVIIRGEKMTSEDVIKLYRHCQDRSGWCDVGEAGVGKAFEMTYYCLRGPFINPCSNTTTELPANHISLLFNYSRHSTDRDVICQCIVTPVTSSRKSLHIQALNLFAEAERDGHEGVQNIISTSGKLQDGEESDRIEQPRPRVLIENSEWRWEVERRVFPVEWQLKMEENASLSLLFHQMDGISFGQLWMNLQEQEMLISCSFTSQPGPPPTEPPNKTPTSPQVSSNPTSPQVSSVSGFLLMYLTVALSVVIILIVVIVVAVAKCKQRRFFSRLPRAKNGRIGPLPDDDKNAYNMQLDGEYCTINEVSSAHSPQEHVINQPRGEKLPMNDETTYMHSEQPPRSDAGASLEVATCQQQETRQQQAKAISNEYGTLNHGPAGHVPALPRSEDVFYDHAGPSVAFGSSKDGSEYHCLRHCLSMEPRVIDNIYDTTTNVMKT